MNHSINDGSIPRLGSSIHQPIADVPASDMICGQTHHLITARNLNAEQVGHCLLLVLDIVFIKCEWCRNQAGWYLLNIVLVLLNSVQNKAAVFRTSEHIEMTSHLHPTYGML